MEEVWIDEDDLEIIKHLISSLKKNESVRTRTLAKKIIPNEKNEYVLKGKENFLKSRLRKLEKYELININKEDGIDIFNIIMENFKLNSMPKLKRCVSLKINNKWVVFEL